MSLSLARPSRGGKPDATEGAVACPGRCPHRREQIAVPTPSGGRRASAFACFLTIALLLTFPRDATADFIVWTGDGSAVQRLSFAGVSLGAFSLPGPGVTALALVGQEVWAGDGSAIQRFSFAGDSLGAFSLPGPGVGALAIVGQEIWAGDGSAIQRLSFAGDSLGAFSLPGPGVGALEVVETPVVVPEPSTLALFGVSLLGLLSYSWRRRHRAS